jgi:hypothetical protein
MLAPPQAGGPECRDQRRRCLVSLVRVCTLDFQAGFSGGRRESLSLGEGPPHPAVGGAIALQGSCDETVFAADLAAMKQ